MSENTPCNYCTLRHLREDAKAREVEVIVKDETSGDMAGWTSARYSDKDAPSAYFMVLGERCTC